MRLLSFTAILAGSTTLCAVMAVAQTDPGQSIRSVIDSQMTAFRNDDLSTAFSFASPAIRDLFGSAARFGQMVESGYPMVWRPGSVDYLGLKDIPGGLRQRVMIRDGDGRLHVLDYDMIPAGDGWQINGVRVLPASGIGV